MKRTLALLVPALVVSAVLVIAAVAVAASSPTVTTGSHSRLTDTSAVLHGTRQPERERHHVLLPVGPDHRLRRAERRALGRPRDQAGGGQHDGGQPDSRHGLPLSAGRDQRSGDHGWRRPHVHHRRQSSPGRGHRPGHAGEQERGPPDRGDQPQQAGHDLLLPVRHLDRVRIADAFRPRSASRHDAGHGRGRGQRARSAHDLPLPDRRAAWQHRAPARQRRHVHDPAAPPSAADHQGQDDPVSRRSQAVRVHHLGSVKGPNWIPSDLRLPRDRDGQVPARNPDNRLDSPAAPAHLPVLRTDRVCAPARPWQAASAGRD